MRHETYFNEDVRCVVDEYEFNNIKEFTDFADKNHNSVRFGSNSSESGAYSFTMTNSFEEADELLKHGWKAGAADFTANLKGVKSNANEMVMKQIHDVVGGQAVVPRYLQGVPTSMSRTVFQSKKQKVLNLVKIISYSGGTSKSQIREDSLRTLKLIMDIEAKGYRVNLYVMATSKESNFKQSFKIKIKSANERFSIAKYAYPLAHPSFLRRHAFRATESANPVVFDGREYTINSVGYGKPMYSIEEIKKSFKKTAKPNDIHIESLASEDRIQDILDSHK